MGRFPVRVVLVLLATFGALFPCRAFAELTCSLQPVADIGEGRAILSGDGRRIAYLSDRDLDGEEIPFFGSRWLFLWDPQEGSRLITQEPSPSPSISDDGRRIVWAGASGVQLWEDGVGITTVSGTEGISLGFQAVSGDGRRIAFTGVDAMDGSVDIFLWDEETGLRQVTHTVGLSFFDLVLDREGDRMAFSLSPMSPPAGEEEIVRLAYWDESSPDQIVPVLTTGPSGFTIGVPTISADGRRVAFSTDIDPLGTNRGGNLEAFLWDRDQGLQQVTESRRGRTLATSLSGDGHRVLVESNVDLTGTNPLKDSKVFLWDEDTGLVQVTLDPLREGFGPTVGTNGDRLALVSRERAVSTPADTGEIVVATCGEPPPPPGPWLDSPEVPGFRFKARITPPGGEPIAGAFEPDCIPETLCVSGAVPGRVEAFLRVVGPKSNGRLWPTLTKLSTSRIDVWVEQTATGAVRHRVLHGAQPHLDVLFGVVDREGFVPVGGVGAAVRRSSLEGQISSGCVIGDPPPNNPLAGPPPCPEDEIPEPPAGPAFSSEAFPDFRVRVRITPRGGEPQLVAQEPLCVSEAICVSGALPGRSELVTRVTGPRPNGRLWPSFVRFSTSRLEIWVEQLSTGATRYYRLEAVDPNGDDIPGLFDRAGFAP